MLRQELELAEHRETALKFTNKKLASISNRSQNRADELQRESMALERQISYLENRIKSICEMIDPEKSNIIVKETRKQMRKIQTQADIDHV